MLPLEEKPKPPHDNSSCGNYLKKAVNFANTNDTSSKKKKKKQHPHLKAYQLEVLGHDHSISRLDDIGKLTNDFSIDNDTGTAAKRNATKVTLGNATIKAKRDTASVISSDTTIKALVNIRTNEDNIRLAEEVARSEAKKLDLPTPAELMREGFGQPSKDHSFTQEASGETILFLVMKKGAGYMTQNDITNLKSTHPLVEHLYDMISEYKNIDFSKLREYDLDYASQTEIPDNRIKLFMACLFHFDLSVANVMRYVGKNYTGAYRDVEASVERMRGLVDDDLLAHYARVMTFGAPSHFVAEATRENTLLHWRKNNHPSIMQDLDKTVKAMNKLEQHKFAIVLRSWIARFVPHIFFTPHHILKKAGKKDRLICDSSRRFTPTSIPINMMTSTSDGTELNCDYGRVLTRILIRIWNLRVTYPLRDIIPHANDVKSCFRQIKHHPDVMGAFSYIITKTLYLSCGLTMGSDFSPAVWEICRRLAEQLATSLFNDSSLRTKHRHRLDLLQWSKRLGKGKRDDFVPAQACRIHKGVLEKNGHPVNTPHHLFVDDDIYAEIFDVERIERCVAAGIESIFILLGDSDTSVRQDPIAWDKLYEMIIHYINKVLGFIVNTRKMTIETPSDFIRNVSKLMTTTWGKHRKSFTIKEAETLTGLLGHISNTAPWLKHLMSHLYTSISAALGSNTSYLICTNKSFREQIKKQKE